MSYLSYISNEALQTEVKYVLDKSISKEKSAIKNFNKNVIDPFGALFEAPKFNDHAEWKESEVTRQIQKAVQNHIGVFHQRVLGSVDGWEDLGTGGVVDLVCQKKEIIAEIKNKFSTVTGGKLADQYESLSGLISPKHSRFKGYTAYFVNIIPKKPHRSDLPFTPSKKETGQRCPINEKIRIVDGASFYELVTGRKDALKVLHSVLPAVIEDVYKNFYKDQEFTLNDIEKFSCYFDLAYE